LILVMCVVELGQV